MKKKDPEPSLEKLAEEAFNELHGNQGLKFGSHKEDCLSVEVEDVNIPRNSQFAAFGCLYSSIVESYAVAIAQGKYRMDIIISRTYNSDKYFLRFIISYQKEGKEYIPFIISPEKVLLRKELCSVGGQERFHGEDIIKGEILGTDQIKEMLDWFRPAVPVLQKYLPKTARLAFG